ncbi:hypothetical protein K438DRAFT_1934007 [Mycena galopus ATCC 62051]|nr:hypothetical protein K438DRAFT_1934007 [Mycena galopus ATCC 62051]
MTSRNNDDGSSGGWSCSVEKYPSNSGQVFWTEDIGKLEMTIYRQLNFVSERELQCCRKTIKCGATRAAEVENRKPFESESVDLLPKYGQLAVRIVWHKWEREFRSGEHGRVPQSALTFISTLLAASGVSGKLDPGGLHVKVET